MDNHNNDYYDTGVGGGSPPTYFDVAQPRSPSGRPRAPTSGSERYYDVSGYNMVEDGGGYFDVVLPDPNRNLDTPSARQCAVLPQQEVKRVMKRLTKPVRQGLMGQLMTGKIQDDQHAVVPDYDAGTHVSVRGSYIRQELKDSYYHEILDVVNEYEPTNTAHEPHHRPSPHRRQEPNWASPSSNVQPPYPSPPPMGGDSTSAGRSYPPVPTSTTATPSNHVPLPRTPQRTAWHRRTWDWIHDHPMISVPVLGGAVLLLVVVIVVVAVAIADSNKSSAAATTTTLPVTRMFR